MKRKGFLVRGIFIATLIFALAFIACGESSDSGNNPITEEDFTVTFDLDGGNINGITDSVEIKVASGGSIANLPEPVKGNFYFDGWYSERNGAGGKFTAQTAVTSDLTVYAKWFPNSWSKWIRSGYDVTVDLSVGNDGVCAVTVGGIVTSATNNANVRYAYNGNAGTYYTYEFEAWTETDDRDLVLLYYNDYENYNTEGNNTLRFLSLNITSTRTKYTIEGDKLPKSGEWGLEFECSNKRGTFYVKVLSITGTTNKNTDEKSIVVKNIPNNIFRQSGHVIFITYAGTSPEQAFTDDWGDNYHLSYKNFVAEGDYDDSSYEGTESINLTVPIYKQYGDRWTGSGVYDIYVYFYTNPRWQYFKFSSVNINSEKTELLFSNGEQVYPSFPNSNNDSGNDDISVDVPNDDDVEEG